MILPDYAKAIGMTLHNRMASRGKQN